MSASSVSSTRRATLDISSLVRRSRIWRLVTYLPSWPAKGEVFTWKFMVSVGSSTPRNGSASGLTGSAKVAPMVKSSMPVTETISPAAASSISTFSSPWNARTRPIFALRGAASPARMITSWALRIVPRRMRPTAIRPRKLV